MTTFRTGVIGLGDMGSGLAKNLLACGFPTCGFDVAADRLQAFSDAGGKAVSSVAEVGRQSDAVFVMVMNGDQARSVILGDDGLGDDGLTAHLAPGSAVVLTATIRAAEARDIGQAMSGSGIHLIDSPVSGGYPGAHNGTLILMAAAESTVLDTYAPVLQAVSGVIHRVGVAAGDGQTVKACLQSLIGSMFAATYEASVLAAKAGISGQVLYDVIASSGAGCGVTKSSLEYIIDRRFDGTGSHIATMHKDLTISLDLAESLGVPMHCAATAMQLFHAGKARFPDGDNQSVARMIEEIVGTGLHRKAEGKP